MQRPQQWSDPGTQALHMGIPGGGPQTGSGQVCPPPCQGLPWGASPCGRWSKSGSSGVTPRQKQEAATGLYGHGGWTLPQATHAHGSVATAPALHVEGGAQDR